MYLQLVFIKEGTSSTSAIKKIVDKNMASSVHAKIPPKSRVTQFTSNLLLSLYVEHSLFFGSYCYISIVPFEYNSSRFFTG